MVQGRYASKVSFSNYINKKLLCESSLLKDGTSGTTQEQAEQPRNKRNNPGNKRNKLKNQDLDQLAKLVTRKIDQITRFPGYF